MDRLTMISEIEHLYFEPPVFVRPGEAIWVEDRALHIRAIGGSVRTVDARPHRPDDPRG